MISAWGKQNESRWTYWGGQWSVRERLAGKLSDSVSLILTSDSDLYVLARICIFSLLSCYFYLCSFVSFKSFRKKKPNLNFECVTCFSSCNYQPDQNIYTHTLVVEYFKSIHVRILCSIDFSWKIYTLSWSSEWKAAYKVSKARAVRFSILREICTKM